MPTADWRRRAPGAISFERPALRRSAHVIRSLEHAQSLRRGPLSRIWLEPARSLPATEPATDKSARVTSRGIVARRHEHTSGIVPVQS